jgi:hypothetical protein
MEIKMTTAHIQIIQGIPCVIPNKSTQFDGYYISYNDRDSLIYGSDTTALVFGKAGKFLILNGDHRKAYHNMQNLDECIAYFNENKRLINKYSEAI